MSPRTTDKEKRERELLDAALEVIARQGAANFKIIDVANSAGVGKGTIYEYFRSKEELTSAAFIRFFVRYLDFLEEIDESRLSPPERLRNYFGRSFQFLSGNSRMLQVMFDFWSFLQINRRAEHFYEELVGLVERFNSRFREIFKDGIAEGYFRQFDIEKVMVSLFAMVDGLSLQYSMGQIDLSDQSLADELTELVLRGIAREDKEN